MSDIFSLFEFGSTSLKFFYRLSEQDQIHKATFPWDLGHEVYETGRISEASTKNAVFGVRAFLSCHGGGRDAEMVPAFATGAFREARNRLDFFARIRGRTGLSVRILSAGDEAALLSSQFLRSYRPVPSLAFDLGGGWLRWVFRPASYESRCNSVPVGAIRLYRSARNSSGDFEPERARCLAGDLVSGLPRVRVPRLIGTGGPIKAIAKTLGSEVLGRKGLEELELRVRTEGPPALLKPHRQPIFHAGLILALAISEELGAEEIRYENLSLGQALLEKIHPFYDKDSTVPTPSWIVKRISFAAALPSLADNGPE